MKSQQIKLVKILEILRQDTDEEHPMPTRVLLEKLKEQGIVCQRQTLYDAIDTLNENGYEIICHRGIWNEYYIEDRSFDLPEIRILMDAVQAANFITPKKTEVLIDKIAALGGSHRAELMKQDTVIYNEIKHNNEYIYYSINEIESAIRKKKKVSFFYFDYNEKRERVFRKEGKKKYYLNPLSMVINNDNYYLVGYNDLYKKVLHFRIDRMTEVSVSSLDMVESEAIAEFDLTKHQKQLFGMYGGETETVTIQFDKSLIDVVVDKFGEDVELTPRADGTIWFDAEVQVSPQFIAWVNSFEDKMKVVSPKKVVEKIKKALLSAYEQYR